MNWKKFQLTERGTDAPIMPITHESCVIDDDGKSLELKLINCENNSLRLNLIEEDIYEDPFNGYEYVDMGEAGIWATCNVGANKPEDYGLYFAWGETNGYANPTDKIGGFSWKTYKYGTRETDLTKYNTEANRGAIDNLTVLEKEDDAASANMGGDWRMPTKVEYQKLYNSCNKIWVTGYNDTEINGCLFTLKTDETKQLFFPAAGNFYNSSHNKFGSSGDYWSSSLYTSSCYLAYNLSFDSGRVLPQFNGHRSYGYPVRGFIPAGTVKEPKFYTKEEVDDKLSNVDIPDFDLSNIEAVKLKTPVKLWGNEFDGSKDIDGKLKVDTIISKDGRAFLSVEDTCLEIGEEFETILLTKDTNVAGNITSENIKSIESKLEGVTKAADDSKVIKYIHVSDLNGDIDGYLQPQSGGFISLGLKKGLSINTDIDADTEMGNQINISIDENVVATKQSVDDLKADFNSLLNDENLNDSFDTLKEVDTWIKAHETEAADIISDVNEIKGNYVKTDDERLLDSEAAFFTNEMAKLGFIGPDRSIQPPVTYSKYDLDLHYTFIEPGCAGVKLELFSINRASKSSAGVMSAEDKTNLDNVNNFINGDIKDIHFVIASASDGGAFVDLTDKNNVAFSYEAIKFDNDGQAYRLDTPILTIPSATKDIAGVISADDKKKLDSIEVSKLYTSDNLDMGLYYTKTQVDSKIPTNYIVSGEQTTTSTEDGGDNVYTFKTNGGATSTFNVKNGNSGQFSFNLLLRTLNGNVALGNDDDGVRTTKENFIDEDGCRVYKVTVVTEDLSINKGAYWWPNANLEKGVGSTFYPGHTYTISLDYKSDCEFLSGLFFNAYADADHGSTFRYNAKDAITYPISPEWKRISYQVTLTSSVKVT